MPNRLRIQSIAIILLAAIATAAVFLGPRYPQVYTLIAALLVLALALFTLGLQQAITTSIHALSAWVTEIEKGNTDPPAPPPAKGDDALAQLSLALLALTASLRECRRLEADRLLRTQAATRSTLDTLPHAIAVLSPEGKVELVNHVAESLFALKPGMIADGSAPKWLLELIAQVQRTSAPVQPHGYQSALQIFDRGRELFFLPHAIPVLDPQQQIAGITVLLENATALRQVEEAKSGLLASLSHELKTPLTSIQMAIHLLADDPAANFTPHQHDLLRTAAQDTDRLHNLIQQLLANARQNPPLTPDHSLPSEPRP